MKHVTEQENGHSSFAGRLLSTITNKHKSVRSFALENGFAPSAMALYTSGKSEPTRPVLCAIAKALDVSLEWLATGNGNETAQTPVLQNVDPEILGAVVELVEQAETNRRLKIPADKKAKIYALLYDRMASGEKNADMKTVLQLISLAV